MSNQTALRVLSEPENKAQHQINLAPAIRAYAVERMEQLKRSMDSADWNRGSLAETSARLSELQMIVTLCDGLAHQEKVFDRMLETVNAA